jgi:hypothetical protein
MPPQVWAIDKQATKDEPVKHHVETTETWPMAQKVRDHIAQRVDPERWQMEASYAAPSNEPIWDANRWMHEPANEPREE